MGETDIWPWVRSPDSRHYEPPSDDGGRRAAAIYTLIATAKLNDIDPQAWLADVLARLPDHPARRIHQLLPWNWSLQSFAHAAWAQSAIRPKRPDQGPSPDAYSRPRACVGC
jgi:hypothetical protein